MLSSHVESLESLVNDHPLFRLALPLRCSCGKAFPISEHQVGREESRIFVTVSHACSCGEPRPQLYMHINRMQRRRMENQQDLAARVSLS